MKKILPSLFLLFFAQAIYAQADTLENLSIPLLQKRIASGKSDSNQVKLMLAIGKNILYGKEAKPQKIAAATDWMNKASALSAKLDYFPGKVNSILLEALICDEKNDYIKAIQLTDQAIQMAQKAGDQKEEAESYVVKAAQFQGFAKVDQKVKYFQQAIDLFKAGGYKLREANTLEDMGNALYHSVKVKDALAPLFAALTIYQSIGYPKLQQVYYELASCSVIMGNFTSAVKYNLLAVNTITKLRDTSSQVAQIYSVAGMVEFNLKNYKAAGTMLEKALILARRDHEAASIFTFQLGLNYNDAALGDYAKAKKRLDEIIAMPIAQTPTEQSGVELAYVKLFTASKNYTEAGIHVSKLLSWMPKLNPKDPIAVAIYPVLVEYNLAIGRYGECYKYLGTLNTLLQPASFTKQNYRAEQLWFKVDSATGKYPSAIKHYQRYKLLGDSLLNLAKTNQIAALEIESETAQKNQNILLLTKQGELKDSHLTQTRSTQKMLIGGSASLLIIIGLVYNRNRLKQKVNLQLTAQQKEINMQNESLRSLVEEKNELIGDKDLLLKELNHRVKNNLQMIMSLLESQSAYIHNSAAQEAITESQNRVQALALIHQKLYQSDNVTDVNMLEYISEMVSFLESCYSTSKNAIKLTYPLMTLTWTFHRQFP